MSKEKVIKGVIFDFNGTMIFDKDLHNRSWKEFIATKTGKTPSDKELELHMHGRNANYVLKHFIDAHLSDNEIREFEEEKEKIYRQLCLTNEDFRLAYGLNEFLDKLIADKIPFTIATASGQGNVKFFFEQLNLDKWFDFDKIVYNDGKIKGKPAPDIFLKAAKNIGIPIQNCIIFEDSESGIKAAKCAGALQIAGVSSMLSKATLINFGATDVINDYKNIDTIVGL